jgi:hypothetical protein
MKKPPGSAGGLSSDRNSPVFIGTGKPHNRKKGMVSKERTLDE